MRLVSIVVLAAVLPMMMAASPVTAQAQPRPAAATQLPAGLKEPPLPLPGAARQSRGDPDTAVQFLYPVQVTVAARRSTVVDLHFRVASGLHVNSHTPHDKELIPTRLAVVEGAGVSVTAVDFPLGADYALAFSPHEKLSVYTDTFVLRAHLTAQPGEHVLQGALRYQACDANSCMPPHTLPIAVSLIAK